MSFHIYSTLPSTLTLRDLPSFPTRRSSDLLYLPLRPAIAQSRDSRASMECAHMVDPLPFITYRSEEHTSELQSHSDLVCRLLLEKKKGRSALRVKDVRLQCRSALVG